MQGGMGSDGLGKGREALTRASHKRRHYATQRPSIAETPQQARVRRGYSSRFGRTLRR